MGFLKRWSCLLIMIVVGLILLPFCAGLMLLLTLKSAFAAGPDAVRLAEARPAAPPAAMAHGVFLRQRVAVLIPDATCVVRLAGDPGGTAPFAVDDRLTLIAHGPGGTEHRWFHDFRVAGRIVPLAPLDITAALGTQWDDLEVVLEDLEPDTWSNTALWLLPCAATSTPTVAPAAITPARTALPTRQILTPGISPTPTHSSPVGMGRTTAAPGQVPPSVGPVSGDPGLGIWLLLTVLPIIGVVLSVIRYWRTRVGPQRSYQVNIYDTANQQQRRDDVARERFPLGIARTPLRLVAADAPERICTVALAAPNQIPILRGTAAAALLRIQVDGYRLILEPELPSSTTAPALGQEHSHA